MVLGIETAFKHIENLKNEIAELEKQIQEDPSVTDAQEFLRKLETVISDFQRNNILKRQKNSRKI